MQTKLIVPQLEPFYRWAERDPAFRERYEEARPAHRTALEEALA